MTDEEIRQMVRDNGWHDAVNTGKKHEGYTIYECVDKDTPGVAMDTGLPTYVLVKGDETRGPKDHDEWDAIDDIVQGLTEQEATAA